MSSTNYGMYNSLGVPKALRNLTMEVITDDNNCNCYKETLFMFELEKALRYGNPPPREFAEFKDHFSTRVARYEKVIKLVLSVQDIRGREIKALVWKARNDREQSKLIKRLHFSMRN